MDYIVHKRFKGNSICGYINIPAMTVCECDGVTINHNGNVICFVTSENAHQFFARHDDGMGIERGRLTQAIQKILSKRDAHYQERWDNIWDDGICRKYKREDYDDYWLWNQKFYDAPIYDLRYIANLVGAK